MLRDPAQSGKFLRIAKSDIDQRRAGKVSIMPAGLDNQLTPQQLADLVEFLMTRK